MGDHDDDGWVVVVFVVVFVVVLVVEVVVAVVVAVVFTKESCVDEIPRFTIRHSCSGKHRPVQSSRPVSSSTKPGRQLRHRLVMSETPDATMRVWHPWLTLNTVVVVVGVDVTGEERTSLATAVEHARCV